MSRATASAAVAGLDPHLKEGVCAPHLINSDQGELMTRVFIWDVGTPVSEIRDWFNTQPEKYALETFTPPEP